MAPAKRELPPRSALGAASRMHTLAPHSWAVRAETRAALPPPAIRTSKLSEVEDICVTLLSKMDGRSR
jgi:hypothetical protein